MTDPERPPPAGMPRRQAIGALAALALPLDLPLHASAASAADPEAFAAPQETGPDLGNLAADPRIKAACVVAWMSTLGEMLPGHARRHTWMAWTPGLRASLDLPDAAALVAPGALLVQQCARDTLFPMDGMRAAVERLRAIYARAGHPDRFRGAFHDVPHSFTPAMQDEAFAWLERSV